jgi:spermidine synthase
MDSKQSAESSSVAGVSVEPTAVTDKTTYESRIGFVLIALLFVFSGFSSLIYQVVWTRLLVLVFGSTTFATSTVLAVFMGGLALGSFVAGRLTDSVRRPFLWYGILEGVIGVWALLIPAMFTAAVPGYKLAWQAWHLSMLPFSLLRFLMAAAILILPTSCMGATLPLLSKFVTKRLDYVGRRIGTLYAANTFGAVGGAALAGFVLLPLIGLQATTIVSAAINFVLLGVVFWLAPKLERSSETVPRVTATSVNAALASATPLTVLLTMLAFSVSGAVAMVYEVGWTRTLLMVIGSSTYAFTVMLTSFLVGIFLGSLICARFVDRVREPLAWFALLQFFVCLAGFVSMWLFNYLPWWNIVINSAFPHDPTVALAVRFGLAASVLLPLTLGLGAIFPVVVKSCTRQLEAVGRSVGTLYSANTLGAIVGAFLAGFVLVPWLGVERTLVVASVVNLLVGIGLLFLVNAMKMTIKLSAAVLGLVVLGGLLTGNGLGADMMWDRMIILSAQAERRHLVHLPFLYRSFQQWQQALSDNGDVLFYEDGPASTVGVVEYKGSHLRSLSTNGHVDASDGADMKTQVLLAAYPLLWKPDAEQVGVVGWGSGVTIGTATCFPLKSITAIELEPATVEASKLFHHVNLRPEDNPLVHFEVNDGRNYLLATDQKFDVIVSEPSNPWQAGVCNLFTREFFAICHERLKPGGIMSFWMPCLEIPPENLRGILASLHAVFPYNLALMSDSGTMIVLASDQPLPSDLDRLKASMANKAVAAQLARAGIRSPEGVLARIEVTPAKMAPLVEGAQLNLDDTNHLEYSVGKTYENRFFLDENEALFGAALGQPWDDVIFGRLKPEQKAAIIAKVAEEALMIGRPARALAWAQASLVVAPTSEAMRIAGIASLNLGKPEDATRFWQQALSLDPHHVETLQTRGMYHLQEGDLEGARKDFNHVLEIEPDNKVAHYHLAGTYLTDAIAPDEATLPALSMTAKDAEQAAMVLKSLGNLPEESSFVDRHHDVLLLAAVARFQLHNLKESEALLRRYLAIEPKSVFGCRLLGCILFDRGATTEATTWWYTSFVLGRPHAELLAQQARELLQAGKEDQAIGLLRQSIEFWPGEEHALSMAESLSARNKKASAALASMSSLFRKAPRPDGDASGKR